MISVIIPAYNSEVSIIAALESVRRQTVVDQIKEVIVINDGSTDSTLEVVKNYESKVPDFPIRILSKDNGGVSSARNLGIKQSSAEWIALLDSDDEWVSNKLEIQLEYIRKYPDIRFIGTNRNNEYNHRGKKIAENLYCLNVKNVLYKAWPHTSTALIHRTVIEQIGYYDECRKYAEDGQFWIKIAAVYGLYYVYDSLEIAGKGKPTFGYSGLSANLKEMHYGNIANIKEAYSKQSINVFYLLFFLILERIKYVRRKFWVRKL